MKAVFLFLLLIGITNSAEAAEKSWMDQQTSQTSQSSIETTSKTSTSQKTYQIAPTDNAVTQNATTTQYSHNPGHEVFEDSDLDGNFGENEAPLADTDGDGQTGEQESQFGIESVNQNQKITVLNNMGMGNSLSSFQAAGQVNRASIYKEEEDEKKKSKAEQTPDEDNLPDPAPSPSRRVLVS